MAKANSPSRRALMAGFVPFCLALVLFPLFFFSRDDVPPSVGASSELSLSSTRNELARRLFQAPMGSPEAMALTRQLTRLKHKAHRNTDGVATAENPGAFLEALAAIKTTADGTTYPPNYKIIQKNKAFARRKAMAPLPWVERGPGNVSGRVRAVVVDPDDTTNRTWFVATVGGGIWKTTDAGATWQEKTPQLSTLSTTCLAMCASQPDVMYAGTGMGYGRIVDLEGGGLWKSIDRGETWSQLASTANGELLDAINRIVVDPTNPDVLLVCSNDQFSHLGPNGGTRVSGIFKSNNGGTSWYQVYDPDVALGTATDNRVQQIVADPTNFDVLYASINEVGVIKSIDAGETWSVSASNFALPTDVGNPTGGGFGLAGISVRTELAIAPTDPTRIYAAVERPRGIGDMFMSIDAGATWSLLVDISGDPNWFNAFGGSGASGNYTAGWFDNTIAVHPYDPDVVFVGGVNLYRVNVNSGAQTRTTTPIAWWIPNASGLPVVHADHHWLEMIPTNPGAGLFRILNANDGGLGYSTSGGVGWSQVTGMGTTQFYGADKKPGQDVYMGGMQDNGTWVSGLNPTSTSNWFNALGGDGFEVAFNDRDGNLALGGSQFGGYSRSTDGGSSWSPIPDATAGSAPFISKIANSRTDPDLVFTVGSSGVMRSDDFGASWTLTPIVGSWLGYRPFANVEVSDADPQVVWATSRLTVDPPSGQAGGIYVSDDGGLSFQRVTTLPGELSESSGVGVHPTDPNTAYLLFSEPGKAKVLRTTNLGVTWEDISGFTAPTKIGESANGFPDVAVFSLLVMPFDTNVLWAGTEIGIFESSDGGISWSFADNGMPSVAVFQMQVVDDEIVVATQGRGVWSVAMPELIGYTPPVVTLSPRVLDMAFAPSGHVTIRVDLRSPYDLAELTLNGTSLRQYAANDAPVMDVVLFPVTTDGTFTAQVTASRNGREYRSSTRSVQAFVVMAQNQYTTDFEDAGVSFEFVGNAYSFGQPSGFTDRVMQTAHPYANAGGVIMMLKVPIRVDELQPLFKYSDVCLVEEGVVNDYTDPNFFDYVIVEGTRDGANWLPLLNGYDSRADPAWLSRYRSGLNSSGNSNASGNETLFRDHTINLQDFFAPGELIFVRFRLHADPLAWAWGWAIDDISIQEGALSLGDPGEIPTAQLPRLTLLHQNYPNPLNPRTTISYELARDSDVRLVVYSLAGRRVRTLLQTDKQPAGRYAVQWDGTDQAGVAVASGVYVYQLEAGGKRQTRKLAVVR